MNVSMKLFPGNESEKPVIRNIIDKLKTRNSVSGSTIQIADKGLNCAENILHAVKNGDGYIFSKSVRQLPETENTITGLPLTLYFLSDIKIKKMLSHRFYSTIFYHSSPKVR